MSVRRQADGSYLLRWLEGGKAGIHRSKVLRVSYKKAWEEYNRLRGTAPTKRVRVLDDGLRAWKRERDQERQEIARKNKARFVAEFGARCVDCGINGHPIIFDFDHRDPYQKRWIPSKLMRCPDEEEIRKELAKCDLVCSNCHRLRTHAGSHYTIRKAA